MTSTGMKGNDGTFVGRVWLPDVGPIIVTLREGEVFDITSREVPTTRDLFELDNPAGYIHKTES